MTYDRAWGLGFGFRKNRVCFDPGTLLVTSLVSSAIGGGLSAASTIAGGNAAATAGQMQQSAANAQAEQLTSNAAGELASSQRTAAETRLKSNLTQSAALARGAASGFDASYGSPLNTEEQLAGRGELAALTDVFNGNNARTGLLNKADAVRFGGDLDEYEGKAKQTASYLSAAGTIAGSAGSMLKTYGGYEYPRSSSSRYG